MKSTTRDIEELDEQDRKEERGDFISEQSFTKEQTDGLRSDGPQFRDVEAIEDVEFENRAPLQAQPDIDDLNAAYSPQADSAGDSADNAEEEVLMGLGFRPDGEDAFEEEEDEETEDFEKDDHTRYAEEKSKSASEHPGLQR